MSDAPDIYKPLNNIRIVTAASLFDGHDAAINIMRRILQSTGAEVIHLGHNRSAAEVTQCAIQEDAQAIAMTSYQGGHIEYFKYMYDILQEHGAGHIKIFGGGGGTILPSEIKELQEYGIARIYSPDDGREMGLQGMINDVVSQSDFITPVTFGTDMPNAWRRKDALAIAQGISMLERGEITAKERKLTAEYETAGKKTKFSIEFSNMAIPVIGITGTGGAGKSSLTDELILRFLEDFPDKTLAILSVDPSKRKTGGALLGDRIRMNSVSDSRAYMRSFATRQANIALSRHAAPAIELLKIAGFDLIIVETAGIGQSDSEIISIADIAMYVMTPEFGAASQLEKIDMIDYADIIAINKFDKRGSADALRDVKKQYLRSHGLWKSKPEEMPVYGTIASQFNDSGVNLLYAALMEKISDKKGGNWKGERVFTSGTSRKTYIIPPDRVRYLAEIVEEAKRYETMVNRETELARKLYQLNGAIKILSADSTP